MLAPLRGRVVLAPLRGGVVLAPLRGGVVLAPLRGGVVLAPLRRAFGAAVGWVGGRVGRWGAKKSVKLFSGGGPPGTPSNHDLNWT